LPAGGELPLEIVLRRDRAVILAALACVTALAWLYLHALAAGMTGMDGMEDMPGMVMSAAAEPWTATEIG
jgi:predicted metal-binding membrane protein